jgi:hypothetical protein
VTTTSMHIDTKALDARLERLSLRCGEHEGLIYSGQGVPPAEALAFIDRVANLLHGLMGFSSLDRYEEVMEMLDESI